MKGKAKFSAGGLKQFLLMHVEKLVLGVVCAFLLLLVYRGATRETLKADQSPAKLGQLAQEVKTRIDSSPWDPAQAEVTTIKFVQEAERNQALVDARPYAFDNNRLRIGVTGRGSWRGRGDAATAGRRSASGQGTSTPVQ